MKKVDKNELIVFLLIFLLGAFLRLYRLDYPLGLHGDEAWTGIEAQRILKEGWIGIWSSSALGQVTLPFYWTAFIFKIFGESLITLRLSFALLNVVALPFFYFVVRLLFNKQVAIVSFFLLAVSRIFIHFSHTAPTHALFLVPLFPTLFLLLLAFRTRGRLHAVLAGFFLGISQYFYFGLRILPFFLLILIICQSFQKDFLKKNISNIILIFAVSLLTFLPLGLYFINHTDALFARSSITLLSSNGIQHARASEYGTLDYSLIFVEQIKKALSMFLIKGDGQENYKALPVLDIVSGIFFVMGLLISLKAIKRGSFLFLFLWFIIFLTGTIFTVDAPSFRRVQPSIVASYIFAALGIVGTYHRLRNRFAKTIFLPLLLIFYLTFVAWTNISNFTKQAITAETKSAFAYPLILIRIAEYLRSLPQPLYVYFYSSRWPYSYETLRFLTSNIPGEDLYKEFESYSLHNAANNMNTNVVYIFLPEYLDSFYQIQHLYAGGVQKVFKDIDGTLLFTSYIPKNQISSYMKSLKKSEKLE